VLTFVIAVGGTTVAKSEGAVSLNALTASPHRIGEGKFWLLITSGLLVERPIALSMLSFVGLAVLTLGVCGHRILWSAAVIGHVASTLLVYVAIGAYGLGEPDAFQASFTAPDYGVSAITAAWLGAVATIAWRRRARTPATKLAIVVTCVAVALFAWMLRGNLNVLDSEHVVAFVLGIAIASGGIRIFAPRSELDPATR